MDIWRYPLGSLLEGVPTQPGSDPLMTYDIPVDQKRVVVIPTHSGFGSVPVTNDPADQLLVKQRDDGEWECVGFYIEDTIMLDESVRKAGLAEELALRVIEARPDTYRPKYLSHQGLSLMKRVHRLAVERARAAGHEVPAEVLEGYKDPETPAK